jgi:hypothetical protein
MEILMILSGLCQDKTNPIPYSLQYCWGFKDRFEKTKPICQMVCWLKVLLKGDYKEILALKAAKNKANQSHFTRTECRIRSTVR